MASRGVSKTAIAKNLGITLPRVIKSIENNYCNPDHVESDFEHVSDEVRGKYINKPVQRSKPAARGRRRKVVARPPSVATSESSSLSSSSSEQLTLQTFLSNLKPPLPELVQPLTEAGVTDDRMRALLAWPPEEITAFFEDLVKPKILDMFQSFVVKRGLLALGSQRKEGA